MAQRKSNRYWGARTHEPAIQREADPYIRLGFAVVKNAVAELKEVDPVKSLAALCWWLEDSADWITVLDLGDPGDGRYFDLVIRSCTNGKERKIGRPAIIQPESVG